MEPRILQIEDEILAADFSTTDGIRAFEDRARSEYTAEELWILADSSVDEWGTMSKRTSACKRSIKWLADEAINLIALIRGLGAGGIKYPLVETEDGNKMIHPCLTDKCDILTGKQIDELYNQTIVSLRMIAARAKENNATVQDVAHDVRAARDEIADSSDRTQNMIHQKFQELEPTKDQVAYLAGKKTTRSINGKKAQAKANADPDIAEAKQRAADDMARAVDRVRECVLEHEKKNENYNLLAICRTVCKEFTPLTKKKNALGKFEEYAPLMDWQGNPIQPDTLRKNYTEKFGTKKANKSQDQVKPKTSAKSKVKRGTK